jgi:hypothetical protein
MKILRFVAFQNFVKYFYIQAIVFEKIEDEVACQGELGFAWVNSFRKMPPLPEKG